MLAPFANRAPYIMPQNARVGENELGAHIWSAPAMLAPWLRVVLEKAEAWLQQSKAVDESAPDRENQPEWVGRCTVDALRAGLWP